MCGCAPIQLLCVLRFLRGSRVINAKPGHKAKAQVIGPDKYRFSTPPPPSPIAWSVVVSLSVSAPLPQVTPTSECAYQGIQIAARCVA
jgi:hypothetical protein